MHSWLSSHHRQSLDCYTWVSFFDTRYRQIYAHPHCESHSRHVPCLGCFLYPRFQKLSLQSKRFSIVHSLYKFSGQWGELVVDPTLPTYQLFRKKKNFLSEDKPTAVYSPPIFVLQDRVTVLPLISMFRELLSKTPESIHFWFCQHAMTLANIEHSMFLSPLLWLEQRRIRLFWKYNLPFSPYS